MHMPWRSDYSQRTFNGVFLEGLKNDSPKRIRWTESDNISKNQWLAKYEMCQSGLRQSEDKLRELGRAIGIDFNLISTGHWEVLQ